MPRAGARLGLVGDGAGHVQGEGDGSELGMGAGEERGGGVLGCCERSSIICRFAVTCWYNAVKTKVHSVHLF